MSAVSIIIPVYNAEKFLKRCLDSLKAQTFGDWEAICVDDGSSDSSGKILDGYAEHDDRFRVLHKSNGGVSLARNDALRMVSGEFLIFVDSDDFLHPQTLEICIHMARRDRSDLVAYTYNRKYRTVNIIRHFFGLPDQKKVHFRKYTPDTVESRHTDDIYSLATEYSKPRTKCGDRRWLVKHCQPWRCLYKSSKTADIFFIPGIIYEDLPWWGAVLLKVQSATVINLPLYYYYPNAGSYILSSKQKFKIESLKIAIGAAEEIYSEASPYQKERWETNFMVPFKAKLRKKLEKYAGK